MTLSEQELKWVERWENRERQWVPVTRWVCLAAGLVSTVFGILFLVWAWTPYAEWLMLFSLFFFAKACLWFGITFSKWRGDMKLRLLLRLIREHEDTAPNKHLQATPR